MGNITDYRANKTSYVENVVDDRVFMRLSAPIGYGKDEPFTIIGALFAEEMYYHRSLGREITVKINSGGGNVVDMFSIRDAIIACQADTHNMGLAASAAGILLTCGKRRTADDISTFMAHPPMGGEADYRDLIREQFTREMTKRTKFSTEQVTDFFKQGGKNHWFNANDQLKFGVVDEIIRTDAQMPRMELDNESPDTIIRVYNSIINTNQNHMDFKAKLGELAVKLGLKSDASETEVTNAIEKADKAAKDLETAQAENARLKLEITAKDQKIHELENAGKSSVENAAKEFIESQIKEKKIAPKDDAEKAVYVGMYLKDPAGTKLLFSNIKSARLSVHSIINNGAGAEAAKDEKVTFAWLTKNNPKELDRIRIEEPENFEKLLADYETQLAPQN